MKEGRLFIFNEQQKSAADNTHISKPKSNNLGQQPYGPTWENIGAGYSINGTNSIAIRRDHMSSAEFTGEEKVDIM